MLKTRKPRVIRPRKLIPTKQQKSTRSYRAKTSKDPFSFKTQRILIFFILCAMFILIYVKVGRVYLTKDINPDVLNIGIVILLTKDPGLSGGFLDSITALSLSIDEAQSIHNITKIALIHNSVTECIPILQYFNYNIMSRDLPITFDDIRNKKYANELKDDGCCGILELLKLEVWTLNEYDYIISMDADMHFHRNFDQIFNKMSGNDIPNANKLINNNPDEYNGKYLGWTHGASADKNQELINGGFLVIRPNITHYNDMYELIKEGDFRDGTAWKGSRIGWCYGGRTIQGIVPYYYYGVLGRNNDDIELDRCVYNNMVEIDKCRKYQFEDIVSNHFTWCQKPWYCSYQRDQPLCMEFNKKWWQTSRKVEKILKLKHREECPNNKYVPIDYTRSLVITENDT